MTTWPGASAQEVEQQVTDKLEKKLQEVPHLDTTSSFSRPGESMIFIVVKDDTFSKDVPGIWYQVRKKNRRHPPYPTAKHRKPYFQ